MVLAVFAFSHAAGGYGEYFLGGVMGDYLGATICLMEFLVLLLCLLVKENTHLDLSRWIMGVYEQLFVIQQDVHSIMMEMMKDERVLTLVKFIIVSVITYTWRSNVGFKDMFIRENVNEKAENDVDDDDNNDIPTPKEEDDDNNTKQSKEDNSDRIKAENLMKKASSFQERYDVVRNYLDALAKPVGSLGTLEDWAARVAALQRTTRPTITNPSCLIFAADHGCAASIEDDGEGCSSYPQSVTRCVLHGLDNGLGGASVLAACNNVSLDVVDVGVCGTTKGGDDAVVIASTHKLPNGTRNMCTTNAMTRIEVDQCILAGRTQVQQQKSKLNCNLMLFGEVGIGNTTTSSALIAALTLASVESVCGGGATLSRDADQTVVNKKIQIVNKALRTHYDITTTTNSKNKNNHDKAMDALVKLGGAEIAAMVGAMLEASKHDIPILVDGFIVTTAALIAVHISPDASRVMLFSSKSSEQGQAVAIDAIRTIAREHDIPVPVLPALSMGLRMGEGTAALLAVPLVKGAVKVLCDLGSLQEVLQCGN